MRHVQALKDKRGPASAIQSANMCDDGTWSGRTGPPAMPLAAALDGLTLQVVISPYKESN